MLSLPRKRERQYTGLPQPTDTPYNSLFPVQTSSAGRAGRYRHAQAHTSPRAAVSQSKQQQETPMKFKREIAVTTAQHIHTCLPPLHTPFSWEAKQRVLSAGQPLLKPIPIPSRDAAQQSSAARLGRWRDVPRLRTCRSCSRSHPCALGLWLPMRMCRNGWAG